MVLSNHITIKTERNMAKTYKYREIEPLKPISNNLLDLLKPKQKRPSTWHSWSVVTKVLKQVPHNTNKAMKGWGAPFALNNAYCKWDLFACAILGTNSDIMSNLQYGDCPREVEADERIGPTLWLRCKLTLVRSLTAHVPSTATLFKGLLWHSFCLWFIKINYYKLILDIW